MRENVVCPALGQNYGIFGLVVLVKFVLHAIRRSH